MSISTFLQLVVAQVEANPQIDTVAKVKAKAIVDALAYTLAEVDI